MRKGLLRKIFDFVLSQAKTIKLVLGGIVGVEAFNLGFRLVFGNN
ncbi:MAG: hypothetical protein ACI35V_12305 [Sphingobacterium composti]